MADPPFLPIQCNEVQSKLCIAKDMIYFINAEFILLPAINMHTAHWSYRLPTFTDSVFSNLKIGGTIDTFDAILSRIELINMHESVDFSVLYKFITRYYIILFIYNNPTIKTFSCKRFNVKVLSCLGIKLVDRIYEV